MLQETINAGRRPARAPIVLGLLALAGTASAARADDPVTVPEADPSQSIALVGPQDLPGMEKGPRARKPEAPSPEETTPEEPKAEELPDWFGGKPLWQWSRLTGNWGGLRTDLENAGFTISASFTLDWSGVWSGGVNNTAHSRTLWDINLNADLEKSLGLTGGTVFLDFQSANGRGGGADAGIFQLYSNIETPGSRDQISELWYEQKLFGDVVRVKLGKINANAEFDFTDSAASFLNATAGTSPTIIGIPAYPDPAVGAAVFIYPLERLYVGGGVFDGATVDGISTGDHSPKTFFSDEESSSWFWIGEIGYSWTEVGPLGGGRIAAGGWLHTADFEQFDGGTKSSTEGFYALGEQQLTRWSTEGEDATRGLFAFAQFGITDGDVATAETAFNIGLAAKGICSARPDDGAGLMLAWADLSDADNGAGGRAFERDEWFVELYYTIQVTPFVSVQPDLQCFINPSGGADPDHAVVGSLRVVVSF